MGAPAMKTVREHIKEERVTVAMTLKELIEKEREAVATMLAMRENYITAQNHLDAATRNLANARIALDMAINNSLSTPQP